MTDSNHTPNQSSTSTQSDYEGTDPDLGKQKDSPRSGISTVQVGASAAAAVTSAVAASVFGVAGTVIGAAVGSIVSTIAGALYTDYLGRAHERLKVVTTEVVVQRIPGDVLASTPLRHLTAPNDLPGGESMRPIGAENHGETVSVPVEEAGELRKVPDDKAVLEQTSALSQVARDARPTSAGAEPIWWKKPVLALGAVSVAGFLIAFGVVVAAEGVIGHPISGGTSGNSFSKFVNVGNNTDSEPSKTEPTPVSTQDSTGSPSETESEESSGAPTETATVTEDGNESESEPTGEPDPQSSEEAPNGSEDAPDGSGDVAPEGSEAP